MSAPFSLPSPCKINLFLHINGRRPDGYHELQTLFQILDYGDTLHFKDSDYLSVAPLLPGVPEYDNLVHKAATALQQATGCTQGAMIQVDKHLPMGGGLGGGSSNAATALIGLNKLWQTGLNEDQLAAIGLSLGADVPVFVRGRTAWGEGVGEQLTTIEMPEIWYLVVQPGCQVNTGKIFSNKGLTRDTPKLKIAPALEGEATTLRNDCEDVVRKEYPEVGQALNWLGQFGRAKLTGTGACIFAPFQEEAAAREAARHCPSKFECFVAQGVNESPLRRVLNKS